MTKDEVRSLLGEPAQIRMIENRHEAFRGASTAVTLETVYEVWDYRAEDGAYYRSLFDNTERVGVTFR